MFFLIYNHPGLIVSRDQQYDRSESCEVDTEDLEHLGIADIVESTPNDVGNRRRMHGPVEVGDPSDRSESLFQQSPPLSGFDFEHLFQQGYFI